MRWTSWSSLALALVVGFSSSAPVVEIEQANAGAITGVGRRAEADPTAVAATTTPTQAPAASSTIISMTSATTAVTEPPATTITGMSANSTDSSHPITGQSTAVPTSIPSLDGSSSSNNDNQATSKPAYTGGLPLQPEITPAWGVGGIMLLLLGASQAFIGVRKKSTHIFLSTGFSAALGVTVLIVYVMNPPVTNAVQGGYLVAVFFTGAVFGGLALVFKEITEGLGCLLGGFCIGMWLLTVKPGGLLTDGGQITGFLVAFTVGFWSLSFSHYTRAHGSMLCTSFSGATAIALGIDCYSRAGLKEFWVYIWGLNMDMFPLHTDTYPVTRSIRVELAITVIVTVFGVIAQMRLWKVIQARRAKEANSRKEAEMKNEETDAEVGRQLEEKNIQERAEWENTYAGDSGKKGPSSSETELARSSQTVDELKSLPDTDGNGNGSSVEMKDIVGSHKDRGSQPHIEKDSESMKNHGEDASSVNQREELPIAAADDVRPSSSPAVIFPAPVLQQDNGSEHGAVVGSEPGTPRSKRRSGRSLMKRLSVRSAEIVSPSVNFKSQTQSKEALLARDDDAASSLRAVADDVSSICDSVVSETFTNNKLNETEAECYTGSQQKTIFVELTDSKMNAQSTRKQPAVSQNPAVDQSVSGNVDAGRSGHNFDIHEDTNSQDQAQPAAHGNTENQGDINDQENNNGSATPNAPQSPKPKIILLEAQPGPIPQSAAPDQTHEQPHVPSVHEQTKDEAPMEAAKEVLPASGPRSVPQQEIVKKSGPLKLDASTVKEIPEQTSSIIHSFRTNEWAKHLADAEPPEIPELEPVRLDEEDAQKTLELDEVPAPVNVEGLLQTPLNALPAPMPLSSPRQDVNPNHSQHTLQEDPKQSSEKSKQKARKSIDSANGARLASSMVRNASSASISPMQEALRQFASPQNASTPFLPNTGSPPFQTAPSSPRWSGPPPLLAVRESMVKNRVSSTSLRYDPYGSRNQSRLSLADPLMIPEENHDELHMDASEDADEIPLSQRRAALQRQTMLSASVTSPHLAEAARSPRQSPAESGRSAAVMAAWRQSVREDISSKRDSFAIPSSPPTPAYPERPRASWGSGNPSQETLAEQVDKTIADRMQRGSMTDLHRQAMRRMQASANRKL
ncbi:Uncharacterized protein PECH_008635 [Penicillium ucsense]|uniref:TM7S3/TM198-like domain-containing protein n=1 Tax=Penicillium ucsense TaxID=2839758 RepID=A0A8J8WKF0_9EURO|nr:Uncharacterized protein PECM_005210 [Penicillium ucsense]KAF7738642.1 Uncharacterized protein PECH_008635 [Penicillium ucsense]